MNWTWQYHLSPGAQVGDDVRELASGFPSQAEAESWVGEVWRDLLESGVDAVSLYEDGRLVYGPMSLHAAQ